MDKANYKLDYDYYFGDYFVFAGSLVWTIDINGNELLHREDGPATIWVFPDGTIRHEGYYLFGKPHKEDGPANLWYNSEGKLIDEEYCLNGEVLFFNRDMTDIGKEIAIHNFYKTFLIMTL